MNSLLLKNKGILNLLISERCLYSSSTSLSYSTSSYKSSLGFALNNTKKRKYKVNHVSHKTAKDVMQDYDQQGQVTSISESDKREYLKSEFGFRSDDIDDMIDRDAQDTNNANDDGIYFSQELLFDKDSQNDEEYMKKWLNQPNQYSEDTLEDGDWKKFDPTDKNQFLLQDYLDNNKGIMSDKAIEGFENLEKQILAKKGITKKDDGLYVGKTMIPQKFERYFLTPNAPMSRGEKNYFRKMDALQLAKKDKIKHKRKTIQGDEYGDVQTVVQSKLSSRILEVLQESPLFNQMAIKEERMIKTITAEHGETSITDLSFFSKPIENEMLKDQVDPILENANIELTKVTLSNDLRWAKVFWRRISEEDGDYEKDEERDLSNIKLEKDAPDFENLVTNQDITGNQDDINSYLKNLSLTAKKTFYNSHKDLFKDKNNEIKSETNSNMMKIITTTTNVDNNNSNSSSNSKKESFFGNDNIMSINDKQVLFDISVSKNNNNNNNTIIEEKQKSIKKENKDKERKQTLLKANDDFEVEDDDFIISLENDENQDEKSKKRVQYYKITDKDINDRLFLLKGRMRNLIAKRVKTKYVPDLFFVQDSVSEKDEVSMELVENFITPQLQQIIHLIKQEKEKKVSKLSSKFSGLFTNSNNVEHDNNNVDDIVGDRGKNIFKNILGDDDNIDILDMVEQFPEVLQDPIVRKYVKEQQMIIQESKQLRLQKLLEQQKAQEPKQEQGRPKNQRLADRIKNQKSKSPSSQDTKSIFTQFNKDI
ncbi:hypothetical protein CYY_005356 [Polysphondylium violaceum]|uniref:Uncharacterized protein n=1 Tax=Polysphondylium violaceum TaxID=133409 RepID=A0A8J4PRX9_9MYCE|nr:hypothetical protein CYY_005356 [Polysphondylium violaceum]